MIYNMMYSYFTCSQKWITQIFVEETMKKAKADHISLYQINGRNMPVATITIPLGSSA